MIASCSCRISTCSKDSCCSRVFFPRPSSSELGIFDRKASIHLTAPNERIGMIPLENSRTTAVTVMPLPVPHQIRYIRCSSSVHHAPRQVSPPHQSASGAFRCMFKLRTWPPRPPRLQNLGRKSGHCRPLCRYTRYRGCETKKWNFGMSHNSVPLTDSKISNTSKMVHGLQQTRKNRRIPISAARLCFLPMPRLCRLPGQDGAGCTAACYYTAQN